MNGDGTAAKVAESSPINSIILAAEEEDTSGS